MFLFQFIENWDRGLLESVYEKIMEYELMNEVGLLVSSQRPIPVIWKEIKLELGFRADIIVENKVLIELKSLEKMLLSTLNKYLRIYASQT